MDETKFGRKKVKNEKESPGNEVLTDQFQTVRVAYLFCQVTKQQDQDSFCVVLHNEYIQAS